MKHLARPSPASAALLAALALSACGGGGGGGGSNGTGLALDVTVTGSGTVTSQPAGIHCGATCSAAYAPGTPVTLTATPAMGQMFLGWSGACAGTTNNCSVPMNSAQAVTARFSAAPPAPGWTNAATVSAIGAATPVVTAMDASGNAIAVWRGGRAGVSAHDLWASRYVRASGWSAPVQVDGGDTDADNPQIAMDPASGRAMLVWRQLSSASGYDAWARRFDPAGGWGAAEQIESVDATVSDVRVGIDASGDAMAVWSQDERNLGRFSVWANRYVLGTGWGTATKIETNDGTGQYDINPKIAVSGAGQAIVVWESTSLVSRGLWTNRYSAATGWGTAVELVRDAGANQTLGSPDIAMDAAGNALLVWGQLDLVGSVFQGTVFSKRYISGWQSNNTPVAPAVPTRGAIGMPSVTMNAQGAAAVIWWRDDGSVQASVSPAAGPWSAPVAQKPADSLEVTGQPIIRIDGQGNAFATWTHKKPSNQQADLWVNRYSTSSGWGTAATHESDPLTAAGPALAMNENGQAVVLWYQVIESNNSPGSWILGRYFDTAR